MNPLFVFIVIVLIFGLHDTEGGHAQAFLQVFWAGCMALVLELLYLQKKR